MKHSKIFLGLTTVCLAITGMIAAKKSSKSATVFYVTSGVSGSPNVCASISLLGIYYSGTGEVLYLVTNSTASNHASIPAFLTSNCFIQFRYKKEN